MLNQEAHLLQAIGYCGLAGFTCDFDSLGLQRILGNQAIFHGGIKYLIQHYVNRGVANTVRQKDISGRG